LDELFRTVLCVMRTTTSRLAGTLLLVAALGASASIANPGAHGAAATPSLGAELRQLVHMSGGPPGAIAIVQRGGSTAVYRAGVSDVRSRAPMGANQFMRIASVAKAFSGAVALSLVNRHVLSLSDTIAKWLPKLPAAWRKVTLAQALQHTSGIPDFSGSKGFIEYLKTHLHATPPPTFLLTFVAKKRLAFTPGTRYRYSNSDNIVVGLMAQAASRRGYNALLASNVYSRLGLRQTSLPAGPRLPAPTMRGYALAPPHPPTDVSTLASAALAWASGGVVSTPADLNRFVRGYIGARLFSRAVQAQQLRFVRGSSGPPGPGQNFAGLAIFRYRTRCGTIYGHTGNTPGYTQFIASTLDGRRSVVVSVNGQINDTSPQPMLAAWRRLRQIEEDAVCVALR
jgi:D-alanyl-D-alanine carboxypeptidase